MTRPALLAIALGFVACSSGPKATPNPAAETFERRAVKPEVNGERVRDGISYGPFREGQRPGGPNPSEAEMLEDLEIIAKTWSMIRLYSSRSPSETIVRLIRDNQLPITVMLGAWIEPESRDGKVLQDHIEANRAEAAEAIRLSRAYPDVIFAVSVGNESQVFWSAHRTGPDVLLRYIREVREAIEQPVTTADDYNFWNKKESKVVADQIDFLVLHAYAMWNKQTIETAVAWTREQIDLIMAAHPELEVFLGETGWATRRNLEAGGDEATQVVGVASDERQARFYREFVTMAAETQLSYFYFEAFDEPWKGSDHPSGIEKHWGLYRVDRTPKPAMAAP